MHKLTLFFFFAVGCCAYESASAAIMSPYINDFSSSDPGLVPTQGVQWSLDSGMYQNEILADLDNTNNTSSSTRLFPGLGGDPDFAKDFTLSTIFTITNSVGNFNTLGFSFLSNSTEETIPGSSLYVADLFIGGGSMMGQLRFSEIGSAATLPSTMISLGKILKEDIPYLLQLDGKYAINGDLNLKLALTGDSATNSYSIGPILAGNVLEGEIFGYRNRAGTNTSALTVQYDSLSVTAIPEPSSIGFVAASLIGGYALGRYWRRRQANNAA